MTKYYIDCFIDQDAVQDSNGASILMECSYWNNNRANNAFNFAIGNNPQQPNCLFFTIYDVGRNKFSWPTANTQVGTLTLDFRKADTATSAASPVASSQVKLPCQYLAMGNSPCFGKDLSGSQTYPKIKTVVSGSQLDLVNDGHFLYSGSFAMTNPVARIFKFDPEMIVRN
jgi:hypothetical protein